ncbi:MAG: GTPase Era [Candidatus Eisenbacteria bacterium]|nr:GTPase Era [Candidatus Eisenbacteria bacterium]
MTSKKPVSKRKTSKAPASGRQAAGPRSGKAASKRAAPKKPGAKDLPPDLPHPDRDDATEAAGDFDTASEATARGEDARERPDAFHAGYIAICGLPNAGKSTLLNTILQERLAIVTSKPQTTRRKTLGIVNVPGGQAIFIDTPGILVPRDELHAAMMRLVEESIADADLLLYVVDVRRPEIAPGVIAAAARKPVVVAINKADLLAVPEESLPVIERLQAELPEAEFFVVSALHGAGVPLLRDRLIEKLPAGAPFYPADMLTEQPERFFVTELIREALFDQFRQEIPYSSEIEITAFREQEGRKDLIEAEIFVETESQKGILIGKGGQAIRDLGRRARASIEELLDREVYLALRVRVLPHWRRDPKALRRFGY